MANFTMTLEQLNNSYLYQVFPDDYPFYEESARKGFEEKFYLTYFDCEIGFETPERYLKHFEGLMRVKIPYYKQLYETYLASLDKDFLLNKDLRETFSRMLDEDNTSKQNGESSATSTSSGTQMSNSHDLSKESRISDGVSDVSLNNGYLTGTQSNDGATNSNTTANASDKNSSSLNGENNHHLKETTELVSRGNIGITSTAELLQKWRDVLINIDEMIIKDCKCLFMSIY